MKPRSACLTLALANAFPAQAAAAQAAASQAAASQAAAAQAAAARSPAQSAPRAARGGTASGRHPRKPWLVKGSSRGEPDRGAAAPLATPEEVAEPATGEGWLAASFRLGTGAYFARAGSDADERRLSGTPLGGVAFVGAKLDPRAALGLTLTWHSVFAVAVRDEVENGDEPRLRRGLRQRSLGLGLAWRAQPGPGWAGLASLGFGQIVVPKPETARPFGLQSHLSVGHDWSLGARWLLGLCADLTLARMNVDEGAGPRGVSSLIPALSVSATYD